MKWNFILKCNSFKVFFSFIIYIRRCDKICKFDRGNPSIHNYKFRCKKVFKDFMKRLTIVINPSGYRQKEYEFRLIRGIF